MYKDTYRFFIELQMDRENVPRNREAEIRRAQASQFIEQLSIWLHEQELNKDVSMAITALGQIQITCAPDIIDQLNTTYSEREPRHPIAAIRRSNTLADSIQRISGW